MGKLGEALVIAQSFENNAEVFIDFGDNSKVDLIIRSMDRIFTVQVKCAGRERKDSCILYLYKSDPGYSFRYSAADCDYFALVDLQSKRIAWIKNTEELCVKRCMALRMSSGYSNSFDMYEQFPLVDLVQPTADTESDYGPVTQ